MLKARIKDVLKIYIMAIKINRHLQKENTFTWEENNNSPNINGYEKKYYINN